VAIGVLAPGVSALSAGGAEWWVNIQKPQAVKQNKIKTQK
jgi:hypothetical protein